MKAYVAGAWIEQHQRARPMIARLRAAGVVITCDWTQAEGDVCACGHHRQEHQPFKSGSRSREVGCAHDMNTDASDTAVSFVPREPSLCPCEGFNGVGSGGDSKLTAEARRKYSLADLRGVLDANVVWILAPNTQESAGTWVELGIALAARVLNEQKTSAPPICRPHLIVSGLRWQRTIFTEAMSRYDFDGWTGPDAVFDTDEAALAAIVGLSGVRGSAA